MLSKAARAEFLLVGCRCYFPRPRPLQGFMASSCEVPSLKFHESQRASPAAAPTAQTKTPEALFEVKVYAMPARIILARLSIFLAAPDAVHRQRKFSRTFTSPLKIFTHDIQLEGHSSFFFSKVVHLFKCFFSSLYLRFYPILLSILLLRAF